jgi:hypothetical protein
MKKFKSFKIKWRTNTQGTLWTMRYYRFSRRRKNYQFDYYKSRRISTKKQNYMVNKGRSKLLLDSFYFENQAWGALHKVWKGYTIAKNKDEYDKMELYARRIQELQHDLGLEVSSFPNIGMSAADFLCQIAQKEDNNNQEEQEVSDEEYQTDRYEQERFTDTYNEYFEDDENKADRFTDDNAYREKFTDDYH